MQATETTIQNVLSGTRVFELPYFQRRYRWSVDNWEEFWEDLVEQYDHPDVIAGHFLPNQGHFLGSIVLHPGEGPASTVARYLLVDGQQRITTFLALLAAFRDFRSSRDRSWAPAEYDHQLLRNPYSNQHPYRLVPTTKDREAYVKTLHQGAPTGQIGRAYTFFSGALRRLERRDGGIDFVRFENTTLLRMLVVEITTTPTDDVNHIFHTLNAAGETLSPLDLIRNFTFMQLTGDKARLAADLWNETESKLGEDRMERYVWAQLVRFNPKATQRNIYKVFQQRIRSVAQTRDISIAAAAESELIRLESEAWLFDAIEDPPHGDEGEALLPSPILHLLRELFSWGSQVHLPLTLELLARWHSATSSVTETAAAMRLVLSYLIRRALCAIPTNNLNRIFSSLPVLLSADSSSDEQVERLLATEQRYWPTDRQVLDRARVVPLQIGSRSGQVRFIMARLESALSGESVATESVSVQPVMPSNLTPQWREYLDEVDPEGVEEATTKANTLGNLTLLPISSRLGNGRFEEQRELLGETGFRVNDGVVGSESWTSASIEQRSEYLAQIATVIWPRPADSSQELLEEPLEKISELLIAIPERAWTTLDALSEVLALRKDTVAALVDQLDSVLAVKMLDSSGRLPSWTGGARRDALERQLDDAGYSLTGPIYEDSDPLDANGLQSLFERTATDE